MKLKSITQDVGSLLVGIISVACLTMLFIQKEQPSCTYPDSPDLEAPAWLCNSSLEGVELAEVGSFRQTKAGVQFQKDQAIADARIKLAGESMFHKERQISLADTKVFRSKVNPDTGVLYVLVGVDQAMNQQGKASSVKVSSYEFIRAAGQM